MAITMIKINKLEEALRRVQTSLPWLRQIINHVCGSLTIYTDECRALVVKASGSLAAPRSGNATTIIELFTHLFI